MDMVGVSQQLTETGRRFTEYGANMDDVLKFIRSPHNEQAVKTFLLNNQLIGEKIYESSVAIEYNGHVRGALVREGNRLVYAPSGEIAFEGNCGFYLSHPDGLLICEKNHLKLNYKVIEEVKERPRCCQDEDLPDILSCHVNLDGSIFLTKRETLKLVTGNFETGSHLEIGNGFKLIETPKKVNVKKACIVWAARNSVGQIIKCVEVKLEKGGSIKFFFCDEDCITFLCNVMIFYGLSDRGLITNDGRKVLLNGKVVFESNWPELRICKDGFIIREKESLILNGGTVLYNGEFVDWDVCPNNAIIIQKKVGKGYELRRIKYQISPFQRFTPMELVKLNSLSVDKLDILLA